MKPSQVAQSIETVAVEMRTPLMIHGAPGVGKSAVVKQAAHKLGLQLVDFRAALRDAVDIMGLPGARVEDVGGKAQGVTFYNLPAGLPRDPESRGILFLDEINSAPQQTQAALFQLVLDRRVGDYVVPEDWSIVAAGNRKDDRGVVHRMPDPLVDRFFHVDFEPDLQDWSAWALAEGIRPEVIAFARFRPGLLHNHDTGRACHAFSTPRGWADVSRVLGQGAAVADIEGELIRGRVGDGAASEFLAFLKLYRNMISPDAILANPTKAEVPDNVGTLYALAEALARRASAKNLDRVLVYAKRMPAEYAACLVASMLRITPELAATAEYTRWCIETGNK